MSLSENDQIIHMYRHQFKLLPNLYSFDSRNFYEASNQKYKFSVHASLDIAADLIVVNAGNRIGPNFSSIQFWTA